MRAGATRACCVAALALLLGAGCTRTLDGGRPGAPSTSDATPPPAGPPDTTVELPPVTERVLPNGLTVLVAEHRELPLVTFHMVLPAGAAYDPPGKEGVAALTADLLRKGTATRSAEELARAIEFLGGSLGGGASLDFAAISGEFLSKDLDQGLELFAAVARRPRFAADEFRRAQGLTLAGIVTEREEPSAIADRCLQAYLYGRHPYGHTTSGSEASVRALTAADVRTFYRRHYGPAGAVLVVIGDAPTAELLAKAAGAFGDWRTEAGTAPPLPSPPPVAGRRLLLVDKPDATQAHIRVANVGLARTDPAYVSAVVTATVLGGGFGSRLIDELRVKRSLTYGAWSGFAARRVPGDFRVGTFTKVETTGEALALTLDLLRQFAAEGPTEEELRRAQSLLTGQYPRQLETAGAIAGKLAEAEAYGLPRAEIEDYPERVLATTAPAIQEVATRYVPTDDVVIVVVGPAAAIAPQLAPYAPYDRTTPAACDGHGSRVLPRP